MTVIDSAVSARLAQLSRIEEAAQQQTAEIEHQLLMQSRNRRVHTIAEERRKRQRAETALKGVEALCAVGRTDGVQKLIDTQGPLTIWGGREPFAGNMRKATYISLEQSQLVVSEWLTHANGAEFLDAENFYLRFSYNSRDRLLSLKKLLTITNPQALDWEMTEHWLRKDGLSYLDTRDVLFEILCECADPEKLERYVLEAIR